MILDALSKGLQASLINLPTQKIFIKLSWYKIIIH